MILEIVLAILASFRLARMIALEDGPFDMFALVRERIDPDQQTWVGRGLNCPLCVGVWTSLVCALATQPQSITQFALMWFAIAGGQTLLQKWTERE